MNECSIEKVLVGYSEHAPVAPEFAAFMPRLAEVRGRYGLQSGVGGEHPQYAWALARLAQGLRPGRVLEVGTQSGGGAYGLMYGMPGESLYVGIDTEFVGRDNYALAGMSMLLQAFPRARSLGIVGDAVLALQELAPVPFDLVHIDHEKDLYPSALAAMTARGQVDARTVCVFHDTAAVPEPFTSEILPQFTGSRSLAVHQGATICWGWRGSAGER